MPLKTGDAETDANTITAVSSCVQAGVLIVAAAVAARQVREARRLREEQAQPYVVVSLETDPSVPSALNLVIKNIGNTAARNVVVDFDPPLVSSLDKDSAANRISEWTVLAEGILTLVPGQSMSTLVDFLISRYAGGDLTQYPSHTQATVTYMGDHGNRKLYTYTYDLDFNIFFGRHYVGSKSFDDLVKGIEEISKTVHSWTTSGGIRTYSKDLDQQVREQHDQLYSRMLDHKIEELRRHQDGQSPLGPAEK